MGRGPIWKRKNIAKKLCPISYSHCPNPLAILVQEEIQRKEVGGHLKRSPGSGFMEQWPVSTFVI
jgi:hypothetical protein